MELKKKVLAISGSTRKQSTNLLFLKAIQILYAGKTEFIFFDGLAALPHFNPDDDKESSAGTVVSFRKMIRNADGVLICTPEYAMGVPGSLKNALDWTVSSSDFSQKPVALITASTSGEKAHASLIGTLNVIEAITNEDTRLLIPFAKSKVSYTNTITDEQTLLDVTRIMNNFLNALLKEK
jgi:NAD(P)H-dependent FMN reductase